MLLMFLWQILIIQIIFKHKGLLIKFASQKK